MSHYDELYALVSEMNAALADLRSARDEALSTPVEQPVPGNLGTVTVSGAGALVSVVIERNRLIGVTGASLGRAVVEAVGAAERRAGARYRQLLTEARRDIEL